MRSRERQRSAGGIGGGAGVRDAAQLGPGADGDDGAAEDLGEGDLGAGAVAAWEGDEDVAGGGDENVAGMAEAGREPDREPAVAAGMVVSGEEADDRPVAVGDAARDRIHHAAEAAAHDDRVRLGQGAAEGARERSGPAAARAATRDGDLYPTTRHRKVATSASVRTT